MAPSEQHKGPSSTLYGSDSGLGDARERIVRTAYDLFSRHGVQGVGIDLIVERSGVAKATLYRHFRSKDELAVAVLARREERWTHGWLQGEVEGRAITPEARLLAIFDVFDDWFRSDEYESCFFVRSLLESSDLGSAVGMAAVTGLDDARAFVKKLAQEAGIADAGAFARRWQTLMLGSIVAAAAGDAEAAQDAREVASLLLDRSRPGS